ncbi:MAG: hypothetical protein EOP04_30825 [Proteobacteria bacterium]|nr:MAG: hypothetical protein EOP04_30825 [Pseudomonadota bacterium]
MAIQGILDFEAAYRRKFNEFRRLSQSVIKSTSELKQFEVADKLNQLTKMKNQLTAEFDSSSQNAVAQEFSALLSTEFAKTTSAVKVFETRYPERNAFLRMAERERIYLSRDCKNPELSLVRDCELLRTLNRVKIDKDSIKSLSDADLKYFEAQLSKVRASPGVGADVK